MLPEVSSDDTLPSATCNPSSPIGALPCDAWHHYYHYQASAQYLWLAETLHALERPEEAELACRKAVFQDHLNGAALRAGRSGQRRKGAAPDYDRHPARDAHFRKNVGKAPSPATAPHDAAATLIEAEDYAGALALLNEAVGIDPSHGNSFFARGKCYFLCGEYEKALANFSEAIRLSHLWHDAYHRMASDEHLKRGRKFLDKGELDLAANECTKALDLFSGNRDAQALKEEVRRVKERS